MEDYNLKWSIEYYEENDAECNEELKKLENFNAIPLITSTNIHHFKDGDLVRYQGMVQDMLNPEYYYPSYSLCNTSNGENINKSGKYRDIALCKEDEELKLDGKDLAERLVFFCIPIPFTNIWVKNCSKQSEGIKSPSSGTCKTKRAIEDEEDVNTMDDSGSAACHKVKKTPTNINGASDSGNDQHSSDQYFPLHERNGLPCIVKVYEIEDKCDIVLNDKIEVIGFLSLNPALDRTWDDSDAEEKALNPPPSLVPRIHAIFRRKLVHTNPLLSQDINTSDIVASAEETRSLLHRILTQILYGDSLAADYLICHLISRVYSRLEDQALGKFSLNLSNIKVGNYCPRLYNLIEYLVTNSQYLPLSITSLNESLFVPKKDYETNRLWSGRLQLPDDTHLIVDETKMDSGKLENTGCLNVSALQNLIRDQEIHYDFSYYSVKYNTSIPTLVLSEGKSMFETDILVKVKRDPSMIDAIDESFEAAFEFLREDVLRKMRMYLTCMRLQNFELSDEIMTKIGNDYVNLRQQKNGFNSSDLHNLLVLSRLLALSYGRTQLTLDDWSKALEMESERKVRLS